MRVDCLSLHYVLDFFGPEEGMALLANARLLAPDGSPPEQVSKVAFWQLCLTNINLHDDEGHGILSRKLPKSSWSMVVSAVNQMDNLGNGLRRITELLPVLQCGVTASLGYSARYAHLSFGHAADFPATSRSERYLDLIATWFLCVLLWGAGKEFKPERVRFSTLLDPQDGYMLAGLSNDFERGGTGTTISFRLADLGIPLGVRRLQSWGANETSVYRRLHARLGSAEPRPADQTVADVRELLVSGRLAQPEVAKTLGMSVATLQRRLAAADTSFRELSRGIRREQLSTLLKTSSSIDAIAQEMGFSDRRSLTRACQDWFGMTPSSYRRICRDQGGLVSVLAQEDAAEPVSGSAAAPSNSLARSRGRCSG